MADQPRPMSDLDKMRHIRDEFEHCIELLQKYRPSGKHALNKYWDAIIMLVEQAYAMYTTFVFKD